MALVFSKKQLQALVKIMETYELSDESEWIFPMGDQDYFCELMVPMLPGSNTKNTPIRIMRLER